jgi:hypothetical protein
MKVNAEKLGSFLELINLSNEIEITECILRGDKDKLSVIAVTSSKVVVVNGELKGDFTDIGVAGIDNLTILRKMLKSFSGEITLTKTTNKLVLSNGKKLKVELAMRNPQYVLNEVERTKYDMLVTKASGNEFTITPDVIDEFSGFYDVFGKEVIISGENGDITFNITNGDNKLDLQTVVAEKVKKFEVKVASLIMKLFHLLNTRDITISANDGASVIMVSSKTDEYEINYLVAPMVK